MLLRRPARLACTAGQPADCHGGGRPAGGAGPHRAAWQRRGPAAAHGEADGRAEAPVRPWLRGGRACNHPRPARGRCDLCAKAGPQLPLDRHMQRQAGGGGGGIPNSPSDCNHRHCSCHCAFSPLSRPRVSYLLLLLHGDFLCVSRGDLVSPARNPAPHRNPTTVSAAHTQPSRYLITQHDSRSWQQAHLQSHGAAERTARSSSRA